MSDEYDVYNDYEDDHFEDDYEDDEREIAETSFARHLFRAAADGKYFLREVSGYKYWGQDWGETVDQWHDHEYPLLDTNRPYLHVLVKLIKQGTWGELKPGDQVEIGASWDDDDADECPVCGWVNLGDAYCPNCGADFTEEGTLF